METPRVQLTGSLLVSGDGWCINGVDFGSRQGRAAFAFLVLNRSRSVSKTELRSAVWGDTWPEAWDVAIRSIISQIRAALRTKSDPGAGLDLDTRAGAYRLGAQAGMIVDLEEAIRNLEGAQDLLRQGNGRAAHGSASAAAIVFRRDFLPGFEGGWAESQRARQSRMLRRALECLAESWLAHREPSLAIEAASEAVSVDPTSEPAYRILMRANSDAGNPAEAVRWYHRLRSALEDELGLSPTSETETVFVSLLQR